VLTKSAQAGGYRDDTNSWQHKQPKQSFRIDRIQHYAKKREQGGARVVETCSGQSVTGD